MLPSGTVLGDADTVIRDGAVVKAGDETMSSSRWSTATSSTTASRRGLTPGAFGSEHRSSPKLCSRDDVHTTVPDQRQPAWRD